MERLTKKIGTSVVFPTELIGKSLTPDNETMYKLLHKLAAYEDTGLEPDEINRRISIQNWDKALQKQNAVDLEKLLEYMYAEEQGRLVVLPNRECFSEAGNTVYLIYDGEIIEAVHCGLSICPVSGKPYVTLAADERIFPYREGDAEYDLEQSDWCTTSIDVEPSDFGKTVFLTREEAEAAMGKEKEDGYKDM